ncbi:MAG TPA: DUF2061 domain-containing protein [Burkholderiales bacterium]|nr:DUF2061 domain-containing protein [Burkholderiales bacterium]
MVLRAGQTISQIALHMGVAFGVMYALTGSMAFGGIAALVEPVCNVVLLPLHDRLWAKLRSFTLKDSRLQFARLSGAQVV